MLYVGRGSKEKRIYLVAQIAKKMNEAGYQHQFNFLGDVDRFIPATLKPFCQLYGILTNETEIDEIYRQNNALLVTSYTESGPLVVMEAMARGLSIISTPVGIVNEHIDGGRNGFVFSSIENEEIIINEACEYIKKLSDDVQLQTSIANENIKYAFSNFGIEKFQDNYRKLFHTINPSL